MFLHLIFIRINDVKNIIILVVIIIGGYMVYTNYMQNKEIASLDGVVNEEHPGDCLLYTSPSPRDAHESRMPSSA